MIDLKKFKYLQQPKTGAQQKSTNIKYGLIALGVVLLFVLGFIFLNANSSKFQEQKLDIVSSADLAPTQYKEEESPEEFVTSIVKNENPSERKIKESDPSEQEKIVNSSNKTDSKDSKSIVSNQPILPIAKNSSNRETVTTLSQSKPLAQRDYSKSSFTTAQIKGSLSLNIPMTSVLKVRLVNSISNVYNEKAIVIIDQDISGTTRSIKNAKIIGQISTVKNQNKLYIQFTSLILADGTELEINAHAIDYSNESGVQAKVNDKTGEDFSKTVISGATAIFSSAVDSATRGLGSQIVNKAGTKISNEIDAERVVSLEANSRFKVFIDKAF